ncbi:2-polyprenyl-3-methyl-5-hydroxy-6-metoxy-1,4-benzoquinol methylase [Catalinimonas alkaloidigena]|uniref:hypothetical protein n=1 Tax=Catalinimonas alkaloidigena TaxID=1075417 RepID=UPI0024065D5D|nr:hypothetical protein [Catalinimonas alkaloidigena]MDF9798748.1 2-polyprenyl-3-methyl-5-hydroxy-6-metoxy-1,4-benzoquinol methylase [Catalinimonas alkaloidigena]
MLAPKAGERIPDAGYGSGQLTAQIHDKSYKVMGMDSSVSMIKEAKCYVDYKRLIIMFVED